MKLSIIFALAVGLMALAFNNAQNKIHQKIDLHALRLQMTVEELSNSFGSPFERYRNSLTYILDDSSELLVTLRDDVVASAVVKFHRPIQIEDPQMRKLTLVQMSPGDFQNEDPSWFFAGKPEEGQIYKITKNGFIESITWVPPFTYTNNQAKNLQVLVRDFKNKHLSNL